MTTHYLDEAERLCDRLAIMDKGRIVACDTPANLISSIGESVLEVRVDDVNAAVAGLVAAGVSSDDVVEIGQTVTACLRALSASEVLSSLGDRGVVVRSATTRHATLDDVYLRLTGGRIDASNN